MNEPRGWNHSIIRVWIPIRSLGATNVYLIQGDRSPVLVDAGMMTGRSALSLLHGLRASGTKLCDIEKIVLTHFHVDHSTLAVLIAESSGATILIGEKDLEMLGPGVRGFVAEAAERFLENGVPRSEIDEIIANHPALRLEDVYKRMEKLDIKPVRQGDMIETPAGPLTAVWAPGHTPGSMIYMNKMAGVAYVGDTILNGITPHVTYHHEGSDPLRDYLNTLKYIASWKGLTAYPGHRDSIRDPASRAMEILTHHEERLAEIVNLLQRHGPMTGYEVAKRIRWRTRYSSWSEYPAAEKFFAIGEALAHLRYLETQGRIERTWKNGTIHWRLLS